MRACVVIAAGLLAALGAGCGAAGRVTATPAREISATTASCAALSPAQQLAAARLVFVGRMLPGRSGRFEGRRVLVSPATIRVTRYLKGHGPRMVTIETALLRFAAGRVTLAEDGIEPQAGERWKIYTSSARQPFQTSICLGSARLSGRARLTAPADRGAAPASR